MNEEEKASLMEISEALDNLLQYEDIDVRLEVLDNIPGIINYVLGQKILEKIGDNGKVVFKLSQLEM